MGVWNSFHTTLKRLLVSDIAIRGEGMADIFVVLYVTNITGVTLPRYGILVAVQLATAILVYIPSARLADRWTQTLCDRHFLVFCSLSGSGCCRA